MTARTTKTADFRCRRVTLALLALVLLLGCGTAPIDSDAGQTKADTTAATDTTAAADTNSGAGADIHTLDDVLRVNHIQAKGTHNSFHLKNAAKVIPEWDYEFAPLDVQLDKQCVRQLEIDVHYVPGTPTSRTAKATWQVFHVPFVDPKSSCPTLTACLTLVKTWSDAHNGHHLLFLLIEPKDDLDAEKIAGHYDELDAAILAVWPKDRLLRPDDVRGSHKTLRAALEANGWPTLGQTRNKAMFVMLDSGAHRTNYLKDHPNLEDRVIFARGGLGESWGAVVETSDVKQVGEAVKLGYLVRSKADDPNASDADNTQRSTALLAAGSHILSSDVPVAKGDKAYWFDVPGGAPSGCNPVSAPAGCTAKAVEALP